MYSYLNIYINLTTPSLDLIVLISSRENDRFVSATGRNSEPSSPFHIGVLSSSIIELLAILHPKSEIELKNEKMVEGNHLKKPFLGVNNCDDFRLGKDKGREGSSAL
jgi:hypothetical protein